jgi:hypothetical protein
MNRNLITQITNQRKLMGLLNEGVTTRFVEGLKSIFRFGEAETTNISLFRSLFNSMDSSVISELEQLGIRDFDTMVRDIKLPYRTGGQLNPAKKISDAMAEKIVNAMEGVIFKDKKFGTLGDAVVDAFFDLKGANAITKQKYYQLVGYAANGQQEMMLALRKQLEPFIDKTFLDFATSKYVAQVVDNVADEPGFWKKFIGGLGSGNSLSSPFALFKRSYVTSLPSKETDELFTEFFALAKSIENKMATNSGDYVFDQEIQKMNEILAKIARIRQQNLKNLWEKWRDNVPAFMKTEIEKTGGAESELYIKYVKYFESVTGRETGSNKVGEVLGRPDYLMSRIKAFKKIFIAPAKGEKSVGQRMGTVLLRVFNGAFLGDFRTYKEIGEAYKILGRSNARIAGLMVAERAWSYFLYFPVFYGFLQTWLDLWEKDGGYKMSPDGKTPVLDKNGNPIPNRNIWGGDGKKFIRENEEGIKAFMEVWGQNIWAEYQFSSESVVRGRFISPVGSEIISHFLTRPDYGSKAVNITKEKTFVEKQLDSATKKYNEDVARLRKQISNLDSTSKAAADNLIQKADSIKSSVTGKTDKIVNAIDSVEF